MHKFLQQNVNQWLCIALMGLMCFWTVLYYLGHKAQSIGDSVASNNADINEYLKN